MMVSKLLIITGASSNHFKSLLQLLQSIKRFAPKTNVQIYDLGLTPEELFQLSGNYKVVTFEFNKYPNHVALKAESYAWKPIIISQVVRTQLKRRQRTMGREIVFWLDAGCMLCNSLGSICYETLRIGIYSPVSSGNISDWTHPRCLNAMNIHNNKLLLQNKNRSGGVVCISLCSRDAVSLIQQWGSFALLPSIICPRGSSRDNHRQDQSILSILLVQRGFTNMRPFHSAVLVHRDID